MSALPHIPHSFIKPAALWKGEQVDLHIGTKKKYGEYGFEAPCVVCKETVHCHDFVAADNFAHLECAKEAVKILEEKERAEKNPR